MKKVKQEAYKSGYDFKGYHKEIASKEHKALQKRICKKDGVTDMNSDLARSICNWVDDYVLQFWKIDDVKIKCNRLTEPFGYVVINKITYVLENDGVCHNGRDEHGDEIYITYATRLDRWGYKNEDDITELHMDYYRNKYYVEVKGKRFYGKLRGGK